MQNPAMTASILVCLVVLAGLLLAKPLQILLRISVSAAVGACLLLLGQQIGLAVGINGMTLATAGLLGLPGVAGLFVLSIFL